MAVTDWNGGQPGQIWSAAQNQWITPDGPLSLIGGGGGSGGTGGGPGSPDLISGNALQLQINAATQAANAAFQQAEAEHFSREDAIAAAKQAADATFQQGSLGMQTLDLLAKLGGPTSAFAQQAVLHGLNAAGLSRAVDAISGKYGLPTFQAPQANPQVQTIQSLLGVGNNATTGVGPGAAGAAGGGGQADVNQGLLNWWQANRGSVGGGAADYPDRPIQYTTPDGQTAYYLPGSGTGFVDAATYAAKAPAGWTNPVLQGPNGGNYPWHGPMSVTGPAGGAAPAAAPAPAPAPPPAGTAPTEAPSNIQWKQVNGQWEGTGTPSGPLGTQGASFNLEGGSGAAPVNPFGGGTTVFGGTHIHLPTNAAGGAATLDPTTAAYVNSLPSPNQINGPQWQSLDKDTQDFLRAAYMQAGYSAHDIDSAVGAGLPSFKAPAAAPVGASGQLVG